MSKQSGENQVIRLESENLTKFRSPLKEGIFGEEAGIRGFLTKASMAVTHLEGAGPSAPREAMEALFGLLKSNFPPSGSRARKSHNHLGLWDFRASVSFS